MKVEIWDIGRPKPYSRNPRKISGDGLAKIAASIKEFGFLQPIIVDKNDVIVVGHQRLRGAQLLGLEKVPVHVASNLTPAQIKAYRIADNRVAEEADWINDILGDELMDLDN